MTQTAVIGKVLVKGQVSMLLMHVDDNGIMSLVIADAGYNNTDIAILDSRVKIRLSIALGCAMAGLPFPGDSNGS